jgi:hypothetical protein
VRRKLGVVDVGDRTPIENRLPNAEELAELSSPRSTSAASAIYDTIYIEDGFMFYNRLQCRGEAEVTVLLLRRLSSPFARTREDPSIRRYHSKMESTAEPESWLGTWPKHDQNLPIPQNALS